MSDIERFGSGAPWEAVVGYSRTVRAGDLVLISGCTATGPDGDVVGTTPYDQAVQALRNVATALELAGARLEEVVRTRIYVTDITLWEEVGRAHGEVFGDVRPVTAMVQVAALIDPQLLVEIEAEAFSPRT